MSNYGLLKRGNEHFIEKPHWISNEEGLYIGEVLEDTIKVSKKFYNRVMDLDWAHIDKDKYIEDHLYETI